MNIVEYFRSPRLQVALDLLSSSAALKIARQVNESVDILEAGTPLIKAEGVAIVTRLKQTLPEKLILADMKTLDVGWTEVCMAADAGADMVSISGLAPDEVIQESVKAAKEKNVILSADLLGVKEQTKRATELKKLGLNIVCAHTAIDQERRGINFGSRVKMVKKIVEDTGLIVAAAGGLNLSNVGDIVKAGAKVIVVGRAITSSEDPSGAASSFKNEVGRHTALEGRGMVELGKVRRRHLTGDRRQKK
ncbi:MAG: orotidine 5'-phosphate decarboxylase / HUMPS family protein [Nitrososphaeria archaeon]